MNLDLPGLWPARATWLLAPLTIGVGLSTMLEDKPRTPALLVEIGLWAAWFAVLVATLAPSPRSLTMSRVAGPATLGVALLAGFGRWQGSTVLAVGVAALFCALVFLPTYGDRMINGSAYGSERRMALRPPAFVLVGPAQVAWLLIFAGLVVAPSLLLAERYILTVLAAAIGGVAIWAGSRILHQLARRWVVFVPAGFVIRDPMTLIDAVLFRRNEVLALGAALEETDDAASTGSVDGRGERTDLSGGALGLALQVSLKEPTPITVRERRRGQGPLAATIDVTDIVFSPTLPGAMLSEARIRGMKIGAAPAEA